MEWNPGKICSDFDVCDLKEGDVVYPVDGQDSWLPASMEQTDDIVIYKLLDPKPTIDFSKLK